jgi:hypothetical protein
MLARNCDLCSFASSSWRFLSCEVVQQEPATSLDPELMGPIAAIGIVKGKPFAPDARMKKIMTEALAVANATSRSLHESARSELVSIIRTRRGAITCSRPATSSKRRSR